MYIVHWKTTKREALNFVYEGTNGTHALSTSEGNKNNLELVFTLLRHPFLPILRRIQTTKTRKTTMKKCLNVYKVTQNGPCGSQLLKRTKILWNWKRRDKDVYNVFHQLKSDMIVKKFSTSSIRIH